MFTQEKAFSINTDADSTLNEESLPFSVILVQNEETLRKAVKVRHSAYDRHVPDLAKSLDLPEQYDTAPGVAVLVVLSKLDEEPLGTMRIQTNRYSPLALEMSVVLPEWLQGKRLGEATRLGIQRGPIGRMVKTALFKAYYEYCVKTEVDWMVITARSPLDRQYEALLFHDVFPGGEYIPMQHVGNLPHRVLALEVASVESSWRENRHPLYEFFFRTRHADICVSPENTLAAEPDFAPMEERRRLTN